jgi:hypothetical protein
MSSGGRSAGGVSTSRSETMAGGASGPPMDGGATDVAVGSTVEAMDADAATVKTRCPCWASPNPAACSKVPATKPTAKKLNATRVIRIPPHTQTLHVRRICLGRGGILWAAPRGGATQRGRSRTRGCGEETVSKVIISDESAC